MCGIAGVYRPSGSVDQDVLDLMNERLVHRGPDEGSSYVDGQIGLAARRLRIIDLEEGRQPIFNEDGTVAVVFNGEIYNHERLRERLRERGHQFETETDTEVLVHLYEERNEGFVSELQGMFAFALWDRARERLVLARDQLGIKPLYLGIEPNGRIFFGSELSALFPTDFDFGGLNPEAIAEYFAFGFIPSPKSAFQNVTKLLPGEMVEISDGNLSRNRYYDPRIDPVQSGFEAAVVDLRNRLERAVRNRLQADVPLGTFLSGGIDSSIITGLLSNVYDQPVKSFSVGFDESRFDETWAAREVASFHGTEHHEYTVTPNDVRDVIKQVLPEMGEPFADSSILPTFVLAEKTRQEVTVALSGDGADELFSGYNKYRGEYYSKYYRLLPRQIRKSLLEPVVTRLPASRGTMQGEVIRKMQKFVRCGGGDIQERQYQWMAVTTPQTAPAIQQNCVPRDAKKRIANAQDRAILALPVRRRDDLSVMKMVDAQFALPDGILTKVDRASMLNSLEVRVPFLDTGVFEFAMGLPVSSTITPTRRKRILKEAFDDLLPGSILRRGKQGFDVPIGEWFKEELKADFIGSLDNARGELIDTQMVRDIYREHQSGSGDHAQFLWAVFVYLRWEDRMRDMGVL